MSLENFKHNDWITYWSGNWSILSFSYWGKLYTEVNYPGLVPRFLKKAIIIWKDGKSASYLRQSDRDEMGRKLAVLIRQDNSVAETLCQNLKNRAVEMLKLMDNLIDKDISFADYKNFQDKLLFYYYPYHTQNKVVVDYLDEDLLNKLLPLFEEARIAAEPVFAKSEELMNGLAKIHSKKTGYESEEILAMLDTEFEQYLQIGILPEVSILRERNKTAALFFANGQNVEVLKGDEVVEAEKIIKNTFEAKDEWTKNWSGNWGLLFGSLYGDIYTSGLQNLVGKSFNNFLITYENGVSSNYLIKSELQSYCDHLIGLINRDNILPEQWSNQVMENTDKIFALMKDLDNKASYTKEDFYQAQEQRLKITTANFSIKKVIDFLSEDLKEKYLPLFTKVRLYTEPVYNETNRLLNKMAKFFLNGKIVEELIPVFTKEEMENYFVSGLLPNENILQERLNGCALQYDSSGKVKIYQGEEYKKLMIEISGQKNSTEIKGQIAFKGIARGKVRIVADPKNCLDFQDGDILVTGMTRPEYLTLMKKSAAFITDAGGLLSHAAIVARELKKPCIIGTEVATKVLKDGDIVEVNANGGIIKRI